MRTWLLTLALLASSAALAKPWNGVEPGVTTKDEVIKKFGAPSKTVTAGDKEILAYIDKEAIKGTKQVQFRVAPDTGVVDRIDVFPVAVVEKDAVEDSFGTSCASSTSSPTGACYKKLVTEDFKTYFHYSTLGLVVFFNDDGKTVKSFAYQPAKAETKGEQPAKGRGKGSRASPP